MGTMRHFCLLAPVFALCLTACERKADVARAQIYRNSGLEFQYPRRWTVELPIVTADITHVMLKSPGESLVIIRASNQGDLPDLKTFAASYPGLIDEVGTPVVKATTDSFGQPSLESHHTIQAMGTTVGCTRVFRMKVTGGKTYFILCQAMDNDLHKVNPGFDLIVKTLTYKGP